MPVCLEKRAVEKDKCLLKFEGLDKNSVVKRGDFGLQIARLHASGEYIHSKREENGVPKDESTPCIMSAPGQFTPPTDRWKSECCGINVRYNNQNYQFEPIEGMESGCLPQCKYHKDNPRNKKTK